MRVSSRGAISEMLEREEGGTLFPDERVAERHVGRGAYAGLEFLHVNARTIINTCHRSGTDPLAYLTDVIAKLQRGWSKSRIAELLPDRWSAARPSKVA